VRGRITGTFFLLNLTGSGDLMLVDVNILPISLESMYSKGKAALICEVTVQGIAEVEVAWYNESGNQPLQMVSHGKIKTTTTANVTYDEWRNGMKWYCAATIKDSIAPPVRKYFEKNNGECVFFFRLEK